MSRSSLGLIILCAAPFCLQLGCQQTNLPPQPSSPSAQTQPATQATPVETAAVAPTVTPRFQPSEPTSPTASLTPLIDLPEFDVSAVIFSKNQEWKVVVDGKPSEHGIFEHPPKDGKASVSFPLEGRCKIFKAAVAINDTAKDANGSATPLIFIVECDGKELWRSGPVQKCGETQPFSVDVSSVDHLTVIVECKGPYEYAHAVWIEPMLELKPGTRSFRETKEGRAAALALIQRHKGTYVEQGGVSGSPIVEVNLANTNVTNAELPLLHALTHLRVLKLGSCPNVDDTGLEAVGTISSLEDLNFSGTHKITDEGFRHLRGLTRMKSLVIGNTGTETITGSGLVHLKGLTQLRKLSLRSLGKLDGRYLEPLTPLAELEILELSHCTNLGDAGLKFLGLFPKLSTVDLSYTNVTDEGIKTILPSPNLKFVLLRQTKTTEAGFAHLRQAGVAKYQVFGSAFLGAYDPPGSEIRDVVKIRYNCRVVARDADFLSERYRRTSQQVTSLSLLSLWPAKTALDIIAQHLVHGLRTVRFRQGVQDVSSTSRRYRFLAATNSSGMDLCCEFRHGSSCGSGLSYRYRAGAGW